MNNQSSSNPSQNPSQPSKQAGNDEGSSKEREQQGAPRKDNENHPQDKPSGGQEGGSKR